jgi:SET domain-containing protein
MSSEAQTMAGAARPIGWGVRTVKAEPGVAPGCGRGLFAAADIAAGEVVDRACTAEIDAAQALVLDAMHPVGDFYFEHPEDKARGLMVFGLPSLINHSDDPNAHVRFELAEGFGWIAVLYALKPIAAGAEITYRYRCPLWFPPAA